MHGIVSLFIVVQHIVVWDPCEGFARSPSISLSVDTFL